ncbi:TRAP transporter substrate-binding protein DctP [Ruicaihuangia caeni]|uniref:TRAP transporter substrate-binding protein DctP n=1 Tax=Ruicaihuangia caeni TaxID=3042517 RepID=A0AAW6TDP7_9MICO|nr:TRAP transporter substrate-binding protein DctP [Klugiella sp. YN-L-19]MDI2099197.1 TRAP transporter substrate-binding protein DctP [Klugiella sp. YN-L-19]
MKLKSRALTAVVGLAAAGLVVSGCSTASNDAGNGDDAPAETITIRVSSVNPADSIYGKTIDEVAASVNEKSDGALKLEVFHAGQIGTTSDTAQQAASGEDIITFIDAGTASSLGNPDMAILGGPFLFENNDQALKFAQSDVFKEMTETLAEEGNLRVLALNWLDGPRHMWGKNAYPEPTDLEGVKVRTPPIETWDRTFKPLGAVTTTIENTEAYSALEQGVVEAAEGPVNGTVAQKWHEVAPQLTLTAHFRTFLGYAIGEATWKKLTPELQELLIDEFTAGGEVATERFAEAEKETLDRITSEEGVTVHEANLAAYQKATAGFYDSYGDLLDRVREAGK